MSKYASTSSRRSYSGGFSRGFYNRPLFSDNNQDYGDYGENYWSFSTFIPPKKKELIKPYLHSVDDLKLEKTVDDFMNRTILDNLSELPSDHGDLENIDKSELASRAYEFYNNVLPKELIADLFNTYRKDPHELQYKARTEQNDARYEFLNRMTDPVSRVISKDNNLKSAVMTRAAVQHFCYMMSYLSLTKSEQYKDMVSQLKQDPNAGSFSADKSQPKEGGAEGSDSEDSLDSQSDSSGKGSSSNSNRKNNTSGIFDDLLNNSAMQQVGDHLLKQARETISQMEQMLGTEELETIWSSAKNPELMDPSALKKLADQYESLNLNAGPVQAAIEKLLDRSRNYFKGRTETELQDFLSADSIDGLLDVELLHPRLRKFMLEDVMVRQTKVVGKIDIYIDNSGSMGSHMRVGGKSMMQIDFCKAFTLMMKRLNLLGDVYTFDTRVTKEKSDVFSILQLGYGGGTDMNNPVSSIIKQGRQAIIITDAESGLNHYTPLAFFIGVPGCDFSYFGSDMLERYQGQMVMFDGHKMYNIDHQGRVVKAK